MGAVAFAVVRRSAPDGYTLGYAPVDLSIIPHMGYTDITAEDFDLLVMHHRAPAVLVVPAAAPWANLDAFLAAARQRPRGISLASSGPASVWQIGAFSLARRADVSFTYVPFPGTGPAMTALLGNHLQSVVAGVPEVQAVVRAGAVRVLAVMSAERSPILPDAPTFLEHGLDLQFEAWGGFMAPRGLPPDRRVLLSDAIQEAFQAPEFLQYCRTAGLDLHVLDTPAFERFMAAESQRFSRIVREEGLVRS
jgi:tripartite-type tricarboxylate transporter receptor subunit TctC